MQRLLCVTGNKHKFAYGEGAFRKIGVTLEQRVADIDEIQGENSENIIAAKARSAFALVHQPPVVTDDSWSIPGLRGFPGPYMKSMNHWFTPEDFLHLTHDLADRCIFINQYVAYIDELELVTFHNDIPLELLKEVRGEHGEPITRVVKSQRPNMSISEAYEAGLKPRETSDSDAWTQVAKWYQKNKLA